MTNTTTPRDLNAEITAVLKQNSVVLFMKGTPQFPQCGFSAAAVKMLKDAGVKGFAYINVLTDNEIREGIKTYSEWPTIPQLFIDGEFIGGADIMRELSTNGELQKLLENQS